jgi:dynein light intermediate chain 2
MSVDIFTKLESDSSVVVADKGSYVSSLMFIGDLNCGKSTLIQTFLKPTAAKDTKPTIALDYNFARRNKDGVKSIANIWEAGGDVEPKLLEIGISFKLFATSSVFICCDLSKPQNLLQSLQRSMTAVKDVVSKRVAELQASNVIALNDIRQKLSQALKGAADATSVRPIEVPVFIIANKFDCLKALSSSERRSVCQILRFFAHYHAATLLTCSSSDSTMKEAFRSLVTSASFGGAIKPTFEINADRLIYVTRGQDNFQNILMGDLKSIDPADTKTKVFCSIFRL